MVVSKFPKCEAYGLNTLADLEASKVEQALSELAVSNDARKDIIEMQKERIAQLEHEVKYSHQMEDLLRDDYKKCELELKTARNEATAIIETDLCTPCRWKIDKNLEKLEKVGK
jgi:hypothetical protein